MAGEGNARPRLRLTVVGPAPPLRGGIAHYTTALVRALRRAGHLVQVVGLRRQYPRYVFPGTTERDYSSVALALGVDAVVDPLAPWTWRAAAAAVSRFGPDLVLMAWWQPALGAVLATFVQLIRRRGRRVAFLCHNLGAHDATPLDDWLTGYALRRCDGAIVHSQADAERLRRHRAGVTVVRTTHPAYDLPEFGPPLAPAVARAQLGLSGDVLLFFGLVRRYKGLTDLIRAMPEIGRRRACTLVVAGEFYEPRAPYQALVDELGLAERVRLLDRYVPNEEVGVYFSAADVVVVPYRAATQSGVVALAQQFHRPVVVTRVGGLPDMIGEGVTGLVVPPADPAALAAAVLRIYEEGVAMWGVRVQQAQGATWAEEIDVIERLAISGARG
ncbi:MAG: glycosyltransferase [Deltaproteobacteria bacterium]|nr:glycosyltransferase [Deltaproteobacteria bacterium]